MNNIIFLEKSSLVIAGSILYFFLLSLLYDSKWHWKLLESFFVFTILAVPEIVLAMFLELILKVDVDFLQTNLIYFVICTLSTKLLSLFLVKALRIRKVVKSISAPITIILPMLFLPIATATVSALILQAGHSIQDDSFALLGLISMLLLMVANLVVFWIIEHQNKYIQTKEALQFAQAHIQTQVEHYRDLYTYQTEIRKARHDIQNKMLSLNGLLQANKVELAKELIGEELLILADKTAKIVDSGNPVIDAVLQSKVDAAANKHIVLSTQIQLEEKIEINDLELGVLIGNAVDNAIEAVEKIQSETQQKILVHIHSLMSRIVISIVNPTVEEGDSVTFLKSSKPDAKNHGFGLNSIRSIVDKYDGTLTITWQYHLFTIEIGLSNHPVS